MNFKVFWQPLTYVPIWLSNDLRAQDTSKDDLVASFWVKTDEQAAGPMKMLPFGFKEDMLKTVPSGRMVSLKI